MDPVAFIIETSKDADPSQPGFQAQPLYVLLNLAVPVVIGVSVAYLLRGIEKVLGIYGDEEASAS